MAPGTVAAELAAMRVIAAVAGHALHGQLRVAVYGDAVTVGTGQLGVRAIERKTGGGRMVEEPEPPVIRRMATRARGSERAAVAVVLGMTIRAAGRRRIELPCRVAGLAWHGRVHTHERKRGEIMIEIRDLGPRSRSVAALAPLALAAGMDVVGPMTADAFACQRIRLDRNLVARLTGELAVPPVQREIRRFRVVELHA